MKVIDRLATPIDYDCRDCKQVYISSWHSKLYCCPLLNNKVSLEKIYPKILYNPYYNLTNKKDLSKYTTPRKNPLQLCVDKTEETFVICPNYEKNE